VADGRARGFREGIAGNQRVEIVRSVSGDFLRSKGYELMKAELETGAEIDALFSHNDGMALGAIEAMKEAGIAPGKDIVIITIDAEQAAINALKAGEINCVVECAPYQGPQIIFLAEILTRGADIPRETYYEVKVFTEWDDLSNLPPRGY
jgi:simple sugar transport system substrate-binding protein